MQFDHLLSEMETELRAGDVCVCAPSLPQT